jgi:peptidoglycan/LPS O-acetylase OafA/YrhL
VKYPLRYMPHLDGLRALCVLVVMATHFRIWKNLAMRWEYFAITGVHCFFVLSGFLITRILLKGRAYIDEGNQGIGYTLRAFYIRRFLRLFPLYYGTLFLMAAAGLPAVRRHLGWHLAYLTNLRMAQVGSMFPAGHLWSLAVEEQFYLIWPLFILLLPRKALLPFVTSCVVFGALSRFALFAMGVSGVALYAAPTSALDFLGIGALVAICWEEKRDTLLAWIRRIGLFVGLPGLLFFLVVGAWSRVGFMLVGTIFSALTMAMLVDVVARGGDHWSLRWLAHPVPVAIGRISYGLYVTHRFVQFAVGYFFLNKLPYPVLLLLAVAGSFAISTASWWLLERPFHLLKERVPYRRPAANV